MMFSKEPDLAVAGPLPVRGAPSRAGRFVHLLLALVLALSVLSVATSGRVAHAYADVSTMSDAVFFAKLDLDYPGLSAVKTAVQSGNYTSAKTHLLTYFQNRTVPVYFPPSTTPITSPITSTADDLSNYIFKFADGQTQNFGGTINWDYHWNPGNPSEDKAYHHYVMDFMMYSVLQPSYSALPASDPKRDVYADTWMNFALQYISAKGNANVVDQRNNFLSLAKRLTAWISSYSVFRNSDPIDANGNSAYLKHVWQMADKLYTDVENYPGNNWYASAARSFYVAGVYFPEFKDAERWRARGEGAAYKYLDKKLKGDGMNQEPAENYHHYALSLINTIQEFGPLNGYSPLNGVDELLERGGEALLDLRLPNFETPMIGDTADKNMSVADLLNDYSAYFGRNDFKFVATNGAQGTVPNRLSALYPNSFAIMKTGWGANDKYMAIENEDTDYAASHSHPDDLSLMMYAYGKRLIVDPGVNNYDNIASSNWLRRTTKAHNTVEANGLNQSNIRRKQLEWHSNGGFDFYHGQHGDYSPINHDRKVFFAKPDFWIVSDVMSGSSISNAYKQYWHFMPTTITVDATTKRAKTNFAGEANVKIVPADPGTLTSTVHTDGYYSDRSNEVSSNVRYLSYGKTATGTTSFDTVLYPEPAGSNKNVTVTRLTTGVAATVATALEIQHDAGNGGNVGIYYLSHEAAPGTRSFGGYQYNGELAYVEKTSGGVLTAVSVARGTLLKDGAIALVSATETVHNLSVRYQGTAVDIYSSDTLVPNITLYAPGASTVRVNGSPVPFTPSGSYISIGGATIPVTGTTALTEDFGVDGLNSASWDFQNGTAAGWDAKSGTWTVQSAGGSLAYRQTSAATADAQTVTDDHWSDILVQATATMAGKSGTHFGMGLFARYQDSSNNYHFRYYANDGSPELRIEKNFSGVNTVLASVPYTMSLSQAYTLKALASGNVLRLYVNGALMLTAYDSDLPIGSAGLGAHRTDAHFDNVTATDVVDGSVWDIDKGHFLINNFELLADSLNETGSEVRTRTQNDWLDTAGEATVKVTAWGAGESRAGIVSRSLDHNNGYRFVVYRNGTSTSLRIEKVVSGSETAATPVVLAEKPFAFATGTAYTFKAVADGGYLKFYVNGTEQLTAYDTILNRGGFGLHASKAQVRFDNALVQLLN